MASSKLTSSSHVPRAHHFELVEGMQLQIDVTGPSSGCNVRIELQLRNCTTTWILHWGTGSFLPIILLGRRLTSKSGEIYLLVIELRDPNIHAMEFVLKNGNRDRWMKLNLGNFQIEIPESDATLPHPTIPKDLIERKAYLLWESKGRPVSSPLQQKQDYDNALGELQIQLSKGLSLNGLRSGYLTANTGSMATNREEIRSHMPHSYQRRQNVDQWLQKYSEGHAKSTRLLSSSLLTLVEKSMGGDNVVSQQCYHVGNYETVVLVKVVSGDCHILVATNMKGYAVLHWGISKSSPGEWLAPPPEMLLEKSKLVVGACQTYFTEISTGQAFFQVNGDRGGEEIVKWLLDEISRREKEAERSLMHRFNIATELTECCKTEELGLIGLLVWFRFMACRHLTWNKNYNVKPRICTCWQLSRFCIIFILRIHSEISEAQDKFTNLLVRIYLNQPNDREIVRLIMACVGRGGQGDVGQRIRDDILVLQRNNDCKTGMMEEWH